MCQNRADILAFRRDKGEPRQRESVPASRCPWASVGPELDVTDVLVLAKKEKNRGFRSRQGMVDCLPKMRMIMALQMSKEEPRGR